LAEVRINPSGSTWFTAKSHPAIIHPFRRWSIGSLSGTAMTVKRRSRRKAGLLAYLSALCLVLTVPILIFAAYASMQFVEAERTRLQAQAQELARSVRTTIEHDLAGLSAVVETLATNNLLVAGDYEGFDARAREISRRIGINIVVREPDGQQVVNTRVARGNPLPVASRPDTDNEVVRTGRVIITGVFRGAVAGTEVVIIVAPVVRDGVTVALINLSLPTERILTSIQAERPFAAWSIFVADGDNRIIAHTEDHARLVGQPLRYDVGDEAAGMQGIYRASDRAGEPVFVAFQRSPMSNWLIGVQVPTRILEAPLWQSIKALSLFGFGLALASIVATIGIASILRRAVRRIAQAAERMGSGEVVAPPVTSVKEADVVGAAISQASHALRERSRRVRESEARLRHVLDNLFCFVGVVEKDGTLIEANNAPVEAAGVPRAELIGRRFWDCYWWSYSPESQARLEESVSRATAGETVRYEAEIRVAGGEVMIIDFQLAPLFDEHGEVSMLVASAVDITDRKRGEAQNARLAAIVSSTTDAVISFALENQTIQTWNKGAEELFGYTEAEALGLPATMLVPSRPSLPIESDKGLFDTIMTEGRVQVETVRRRKDGTLVDVSATGTKIIDAAGNVIGVSAIFRDITARKQAEERQNLLIRELHHRIKNTLATVQAIAGASMRSTQNVAEFRETFAARLGALADTHTLLTDTAWAGASMRELLEAQLHSFVGFEENRIVLDGPELLLPSEFLIAIGMVAHELATNAIKYGALTAPAGRIVISWEVQTRGTERHLQLKWQETGGPPVEKPMRTGFGSLLLERVIGPQLNGKVSVDYRPTGVEVVIDAALPAEPDVKPAGEERAA
jgi:PAS domain S-box-containing protein